MIKSIFIAVTMIFISCKTGPESYEVEKIEKINEIEIKADTCEVIVNTFPTTFTTFKNLYGFDDVKGKGILYDKYEENIDTFFSCQNISTQVKLHKAIKICIDGMWDADAVSLFQYNTLELIKTNPKEAETILNNLSKNEYSSVWHFLFDGPHPNNKENIKNVEYFSQIFGENNKQTKTLKKEFEKLKADYSH